MKKLSIIIPFYNVEKYLKECYESVYLSSEEYLEDIEIILVDDCGYDNSSKIANEIIKKSTKIIKNNTNLGLGGARNTGVENSTGQWLMFIDSDDKIHPDTIKLILKEISKDKEINVIKYGFTEVYRDKNIEYTFDEDDYDMHKPIMSWSKVIKKDLFVKFENHLKHEDEYWKYKFIIINKNRIKISKINKPLYLYNRTNEDSITAQVNYDDINFLYSQIVNSYLTETDDGIKEALYEMLLSLAIGHCLLNFNYKLAKNSLVALKNINSLSIKKNYRYIKKMNKHKLKRRTIERDR